MRLLPAGTLRRSKGSQESSRTGAGTTCPRFSGSSHLPILSNRVGHPIVSGGYLIYPQFTSHERKEVQTRLVQMAKGDDYPIFHDVKVGAVALRPPFVAYEDRHVQAIRLLELNTGQSTIVSESSPIPEDNFALAFGENYIAWTHVTDQVVHLRRLKDDADLTVRTPFQNVETFAPQVNGKRLVFLGRKEGESRLFYARLP